MVAEYLYLGNLRDLNVELKADSNTVFKSMWLPHDGYKIRLCGNGNTLVQSFDKIMNIKENEDGDHRVQIMDTGIQPIESVRVSNYHMPECYVKKVGQNSKILNLGDGAIYEQFTEINSDVIGLSFYLDY
jgi:hypothetical protein